jgi:hypothetical protein
MVYIKERIMVVLITPVNDTCRASKGHQFTLYPDKTTNIMTRDARDCPSISPETTYPSTYPSPNITAQHQCPLVNAVLDVGMKLIEEQNL